ncbi:Zinc finger protein 235 [Blattella germanica]|nr:Zinc finger protein 235 [Blattella germanica]
MLIHSGDRPFACDVCDIHYEKKSKFNIHMLTHTGNIAFSCAVCGKLSQKSALERHMNVHTGEHPFSCELPSNMK